MEHKAYIDSLLKRLSTCQHHEKKVLLARLREAILPKPDALHPEQE